MTIVKKFGGTSVGTVERMFKMADRCIEDYKKGNKVVVVLSAMGDFTDDLVSKARQINNNMSKREMDMLFTVGEQSSVALGAMAFEQRGVPAVSLNAFQVRILTDDNYGDATIEKIETERIEKELDKGKIVLVTGFQGIDKNNNYTTLGRGGSDTTAVALAVALKADRCEIFTDVDGVYMEDPRKVENAKKFENVSYDEMLDMANHGAKVLHNKCVKIAKDNNVELVVKSSLVDVEGTTVSNRESKLKEG